MKNFIDDNWLIGNKTGVSLFHEVASSLPIIDFHNHINPHNLAENRCFENLAQIWVNEDPYKHRAMRICGIAEEEITGNASDFQKFYNWAETLPKTMGNPLFHWSALELKRVFGIDDLLNSSNAREIWDSCNEKLQQNEFSSRSLVSSFGSEILITSDDILDDLESHHSLHLSQFETQVLPSLRADSLVTFSKTNSKNWIEKLGTDTRVSINSLQDFLEAVKIRLDYFGESGCLFADHGLDAGFSYMPTSEEEASKIFKQLISEDYPIEMDLIRLKSFLLHFLGTEYGKRNWIMQLHIGAQRKTSSRLRKLAGAAGGFASIGNACDINSLTLFLDGLEQVGALPETILYTLNPTDNAAFASLTGSYTEDGIIGKIQFGPAWWYNDHEAGIRNHLSDLSSYGVLNSFIGMTTDSRSILSLSRHEYFRRILCDQIGACAEAGKIPNDTAMLTDLISNISYQNIKTKIQKRQGVCQK